MAETTTDTPATVDGETTDDGDGFAPITSQADLTRIITERVSRERAKYADFDDLKAKAERFDELADANKSEIEKANEKAAQAARESEQARAEALRWKVAAKHGITDEDAELFLHGTDEDTLTKQAKRLQERASDRKRQGNHVPREGTNTSAPKTDDMREFTRNLFGKGD